MGKPTPFPVPPPFLNQMTEENRKTGMTFDRLWGNLPGEQKESAGLFLCPGCFGGISGFPLVMGLGKGACTGKKEERAWEGYGGKRSLGGVGELGALKLEGKRRTWHPELGCKGGAGWHEQE